MISLSLKNNKRLGFSLLELILAIAIFSLGSYAMATMLIDSNLSTRLSIDRTEALQYAKEGILAAKSLRDNSWDSLTEGSHGVIASSTAGVGWEFLGSSDLVNNKYTRVVDVVISTTSSSIKNVTVTIQWPVNSAHNASVVLNTILTDWGVVAGSAADPVIMSGLVSYWSFDDSGTNSGTGTTTDYMGVNDGTVVGATATSGVKSVANSAFFFGAAGKYINFGNPSSLRFITGTNSFTLSAWFNFTGNKENNTIVVKQGSVNTGLGYALFGRASGKVDFSLCQNSIGCSGGLIESGVIGLNTWHLATGVYTASTNKVELFIDGISVASDTYSQGILTSDGLFYVGNDSDGIAGRYLDGSVDNVRVYNRALDSGDIMAIYNFEKP